MAELANCIRCEAVFVKTTRDICQDCYQQEEKDFDTVYSFLKQKKNREATLYEIVDATGVEEEVIIKFIKEKRLRTSQYTKLAYSCERCRTPIISEKICPTCSEELKNELEQYEKIEKITQKQNNNKTNAYYSFNKDED